MKTKDVQRAIFLFLQILIFTICCEKKKYYEYYNKIKLVAVNFKYFLFISPFLQSEKTAKKSY